MAVFKTRGLATVGWCKSGGRSLLLTLSGALVALLCLIAVARGQLSLMQEVSKACEVKCGHGLERPSYGRGPGGGWQGGIGRGPGGGWQGGIGRGPGGGWQGGIGRGPGGGWQGGIGRGPGGGWQGGISRRRVPWFARQGDFFNPWGGK